MTLKPTSDKQFTDQLTCAFMRKDEPTMRRACQRRLGAKIITGTLDNIRLMIGEAALIAMSMKKPPMEMPIARRENLVLCLLIGSDYAMNIIGITVRHKVSTD